MIISLCIVREHSTLLDNDKYCIRTFAENAYSNGTFETILINIHMLNTPKNGILSLTYSPARIVSVCAVFGVARP